MRELSQKNPYWLPKYRYLEMKNFALQYNDWQKQIASANLYVRPSTIHVDAPMIDAMDILLEPMNKMRMVEKAAEKTDPVLGHYIFLAATRACTYDNLRLLHNIPCNRNIYYDNLRKFYWLLSDIRK